MNADYERVERAILYIRHHAGQQPDLETVARHVSLSPCHFQRLFQRWAGVTPKRFLEFLTVEKAKSLLQQSMSVLDTSLETGLSGPGRLHDQFIAIEAVSPGEYKGRGRGMNMDYGFHDSPFGEVLLTTSSRGIVALSFIDKDERETALAELMTAWPNARFTENSDCGKPVVRRLFGGNTGEKGNILLRLRGTNFQVKVWNALLGIPAGRVVSYQYVADKIARPRSVRAVANAIAANPVAYLIPCHRVLRSSGELSGYRWGAERKQLMLAREWAQDSGRAEFRQ